MSENKDEAKGDLQPLKQSENKRPDAYGNLPIPLTPEELSQSGTQKLIVSDLYESKARVKEYEEYKDKYYNVLIEKSVLEEKLKKDTRAEILYKFSTAVGGILIGVSFKIFDKSEWIAGAICLFGILLIIGGTLFKEQFKK